MERGQVARAGRPGLQQCVRRGGERAVPQGVQLWRQEGRDGLPEQRRHPRRGHAGVVHARGGAAPATRAGVGRATGARGRGVGVRRAPLRNHHVWRLVEPLARRHVAPARGRGDRPAVRVHGRVACDRARVWLHRDRDIRPALPRRHDLRQVHRWQERGAGRWQVRGPHYDPRGDAQLRDVWAAAGVRGGADLRRGLDGAEADVHLLCEHRGPQLPRIRSRRARQRRRRRRDALSHPGAQLSQALAVVQAQHCVHCAVACQCLLATCAAQKLRRKTNKRG